MLTLLIIIPIIGVLFILLLRERWARVIGAIFTFIPLAISIYLYKFFEPTNTNYQFEVNYDWVKVIGISYHLGIDGISYPLLILTTLLTFLSVLFSWDIEKRRKEYFALLLIIEIGIIGVFISLDFFLFYVFWEIVLIPMYFLIGIWGGPNKDYAAIKFFIYTHVGSIVMLLGIMAIYFQTEPIIGYYTFDMVVIQQAVAPNISSYLQTILFLVFLFGFAVKMPIFPLHTWLPDAHVEAPTAGSVLLAGLLLKMGGYGLIRIAVTMFPWATVLFSSPLAIIAVISIIYGALVCLAQEDLKKMVAFSSISHMGFVLLGASSLTAIGISGAVFQMFNHGLVTAVLFMMCGVIHHKAGTRQLSMLGGIAPKMPVAAGIFVVGSLASLGLPGLANFVSEFMVYVGTYYKFSFWVIIPVLSAVLTAGYYLWAIERSFFGPFNPSLGKVEDLDKHELIPLSILITLLVIIGVFPAIILHIIIPSSLNISWLLEGFSI
ncbi:MAG: NADH-quinone oxidoreductase subunit M [Candidatus Thermoplasmatota archaeon]